MNTRETQAKDVLENDVLQWNGAQQLVTRVLRVHSAAFGYECVHVFFAGGENPLVAALEAPLTVVEPEEPAQEPERHPDWPRAVDLPNA